MTSFFIGRTSLRRPNLPTANLTRTVTRRRSGAATQWPANSRKVPGLRPAPMPISGSHRLDSRRQARLVACSLVLVHDLLVGDSVDDRLRVLEDLGSSSLVAGFDRLANSLHCGTQTRTQAGVVGVLGDGLARALASLCGICHLSRFPEFRCVPDGRTEQTADTIKCT